MTLCDMIEKGSFNPIPLVAAFLGDARTREGIIKELTLDIDDISDLTFSYKAYREDDLFVTFKCDQYDYDAIFDKNFLQDVRIYGTDLHCQIIPKSFHIPQNIFISTLIHYFFQRLNIQISNDKVEYFKFKILAF